MLTTTWRRTERDSRWLEQYYARPEFGTNDCRWGMGFIATGPSIPPFSELLDLPVPVQLLLP